MKRKDHTGKELFYKWLDTPKSERVPYHRKELCKQLGVTNVTLWSWEKKRPLKEEPTQEEELKEVLVWLKQACERGNAAAGKVWLQAKGLLIEKTEQKVKLEISAEDYAREHSENRKWLREHGYVEEVGVGQVQSIPALLSENIREGAGQTQGNNPI